MLTNNQQPRDKFEKGVRASKTRKTKDRNSHSLKPNGFYRAWAFGRWMEKIDRKDPESSDAKVWHATPIEETGRRGRLIKEGS